MGMNPRFEDARSHSSGVLPLGLPRSYTDAGRLVAHYSHSIVAGGLEESSDSVDQDWRRYLTEYLWRAVWTRPLLDVEQRMIRSLAALSWIGGEQALRNYIRAAIRVGLSQDEVKELFYHLTFYIGLPHARRGKTLANDVLSSL